MFDFFRRQQKVAFLALGIILMIIWGASTVLYRENRTDRGAIYGKVWGRNVTQGEVNDIIEGRRGAATFAKAVYDEFPKSAKRELIGQLFSRGQQLSAQSALQDIAFLGKAEQLGIHFDDDDVNQFISDMSGGKLSKKKYEEIMNRRKAASGDETDEAVPGISEYKLFKAIRENMTIMTLLKGIASNTPLESPLESWNRFAPTQSARNLEFVRFSAEKFLDPEAKPADDKPLRDIYDQFKNQLPDPATKRPGFKTPEKINAELIVAKVDDFLGKVTVSEDEIKAHYDVNKDKYRELERPSDSIPLPPTRPLPPPPGTKTDSKPEAKPADPPAKAENKDQPAKPETKDGKSDAAKKETKPADAPKTEQKPAAKAEEKPAGSTKEAPKAEQKPATKAEEKPAAKPETKKQTSSLTNGLSRLALTSVLLPLQDNKAEKKADAKAPEAPKPEAKKDDAPKADAKKEEPKKQEPAKADEKKPEPIKPIVTPSNPIAPKPDDTKQGEIGKLPAPDLTLAPKYKPLEKVRGEIENEIKRNKARELARKALEKVEQEVLIPYYKKLLDERAAFVQLKNPKADTKVNVDMNEFKPTTQPPNMDEVAKKNGLKLITTGVKTADEIAKDPQLGSSVKYSAPGQMPGVERLPYVLAGEDTFIPMLFQDNDRDPDVANYYLGWATQREPSSTIPFDKAQADCLAYWRLQQASTKAKEAASKFLEDVKRANGDLKKVAADKQVTLETTGKFEQATAGFEMNPFSTPQGPVLRDVPKIERAGPEFVINSFKLPLFETALMTDSLNQNHFVLRPIERVEPDFDSFMTRFQNEQLERKFGRAFGGGVTQRQSYEAIQQILKESGFDALMRLGDTDSDGG